MDEKKICPVCDTEIPADADTCPVCGMYDLNRIFLDKESYEEWVKTTLDPYRSRYRYNQAIVAVAAGYEYTVGLKKGGTVVAAGWRQDEQFLSKGVELIKNWKDIVSVVAEDDHIIGLKKDGTVVVDGYRGYVQGRWKKDVGSWRDIVSIATNGGDMIVGLKRDGTVVTSNRWYVPWQDLSGKFAVGSWEDIGNWRNIVSVAVGHNHIVGLKEDGTVAAFGCDNLYGECDVGNWRDIVSVAVGGLRTVGLKRDGTVVAVGQNDRGQCEVGSWKDIASIAVCGSFTAGLKRDGTVVVAGRHGGGYGRYDVESWKDIVSVDISSTHIIGLKKDGTIVVAVGDNLTEEYGKELCQRLLIDT